MKTRIHKVLADHGVGSRRGIESLIRQKKVLVNGSLATIGQLVSERDIFQVEGKTIKLLKKDPTQKRILMYNKKVGEISSRNDPDHKKTIFDSLPRLRSGRWVSIGRLDINTSGLILFTNDGALANKLMHPSSEMDREYAVRVVVKVEDVHIKVLTTGIELEDGLAKFHRVTLGGGEGANRLYHVVVREGRKREVRRLWEALEFKVSRLIRTRFGDIRLPDNLRANQTDYLKPKQVEALMKAVNLKE